MTRQEYKKKLEKGIVLFQLPGPADDDLNPRLLLNSRGIYADECFTGLFPDSCWFISEPVFRDICPIGLFVRS